MLLARTLLLLCALCAPGPVYAQDVRDQLPIEPAELYGAMLAMADRSDWSRLEGAFALLAPLAEQVDRATERAPGETLRSAIANQNQIEVRDSLLRFVAFAVSDVLARAASEGGEPARRELVRTAFAEFVAISPTLKALSFDTNRRLERDFRVTYAQAEHDPAAFAISAHALATLLTQLGGA